MMLMLTMLMLMMLMLRMQMDVFQSPAPSQRDTREICSSQCARRLDHYCILMRKRTSVKHSPGNFCRNFQLTLAVRLAATNLEIGLCSTWPCPMCTSQQEQLTPLND